MAEPAVSFEDAGRVLHACVTGCDDLWSGYDDNDRAEWIQNARDVWDVLTGLRTVESVVAEYHIEPPDTEGRP